ncbi:ribonuclease H-like domain-containing protein [Tanacetum coccineum]
MRIEQYFLMTDYALWEVILNGDSPLPTRTVDGVETAVPPTTADQKLARKNELKARGTLLMALPNEHQLKFNSYKSAKSLMEAIEKRFGEGLDQIYDRLQKLISQLEIHGETISQEDLNMKLLRSLPSEWKTHTLIWRNKPDLETLSMDDLYNNLKIYEAETPHGVSATNSKANASTLPNVDSLSDAVIYSFFARDRLEVADGTADNESKEISQEDMKRGHFAREFKAPKQKDNRNREITRRTMPIEETISNALVSQCDRFGYDRSDQAEEGRTNFALMAYTSLSSSSSDTENEPVFEEDIKILKLDIMLRDNALTELRKKFEKAKKERDDLKLTLEKFENSSKNLRKLLNIQVSDKFKTGVGYDSQVFDSQVNDKYKIGEGYHAVPPPYTGNFVPPKYDFVLADKDGYVFSESVTSVPDIATSKAKTTEFKSKQRKHSFAKVEFVKSNEHVKSPRESVKKVENNKQAKYPRKNSQSPRENGGKPVWNNARRVNHQNSQRITHSHPKRNFVPRAVLMKSGFKTLNTVRQSSSRAIVSVNTAYTRPTVNSARPTSNVFNRAHSHVKRPFNKYTTNKNNNFNDKVNTVRENVTTVGLKAVVSDNKGNKANVVKASACWVWRPKHKVLEHVSRNNGASMSFKRLDYVDAQGRSKKEEVYVCQPPGFEDPEFPDRVYKVEKALYGLHQASRA